MPSDSKRPEPPKFKPASAKLMIGSIDDPNLTISAQYNPREVTIAQAGSWAEHQKKDTEDSKLHLEFGTTQARTMSVELLFDGYETNGLVRRITGNMGDDGGRGAATVEGAIAILQQLFNVRATRNSKLEDWRPHFCVVVWGQNGVPSFTCVIDSLQTKYQAFTTTGKVLRATVTLNLKEACRVDRDKRAPLNAEAMRRDAAGTRRLAMLGLPKPE